jgi:hypothetical protein
MPLLYRSRISSLAVTAEISADFVHLCEYSARKTSSPGLQMKQPFAHDIY